MSKSETNISQRTSNYYHRPRIISLHSFKVLFFLIVREGSAYFSEIKAYLNRSSSQVSQIMKRLKLKNYIETNNHRPLEYTITELGRKVNRQTIKDFLKYNDKKSKNRKKKNIEKSLTSYQNSNIEEYWFKYADMEEYYKDILIGFFIELPEILVGLNIDFTPEKYHRFVEETKACLEKYNFVL